MFFVARSSTYLVETPVVDDRDVHEVELLKNQPKGLNGTLESRGVSLVESESFFLEQLAALDRLGLTGLRQGAVNPTGEEILLVPGTFSMTDQDKSVLHIQTGPRRTDRGRRAGHDGESACVERKNSDGNQTYRLTTAWPRKA